MLRGVKIDNQLLRLSDIVDGEKQIQIDGWLPTTGRNEIQKIFESQGLQVSRLKRVVWNNISLRIKGRRLAG